MCDEWCAHEAGSPGADHIYQTSVGEETSPTGVWYLRMDSDFQSLKEYVCKEPRTYLEGYLTKTIKDYLRNNADAYNNGENHRPAR